MTINDILPADAIKKLKWTVKTYFRTKDQTKEIKATLLPYKELIEKHLPIDALVTQVEEMVTAQNAKNLQAKNGRRVKVHDGTGTRFLGYGKYVGNVTVYVIQMPDGSLRSETNAEIKPDYIPPGAVLRASPNNPKIILEDNRIVYGCQVWWEYAEPEKDILPVDVEFQQAYQNN